MKQNRVNSLNNVLQYLSTSTASVITSTTAIPIDNTIPQNTEGTQALTLSITPKFSTSKLLIEYNAQMNVDTTNVVYLTTALFQDSNVNAIAAITLRLARDNILRYVMTSGTTSSTTFSIRVGPESSLGTLWVNADTTGTRLMGGVSLAWLTITEYAA
jgi:hypothetical protein